MDKDPYMAAINASYEEHWRFVGELRARYRRRQRIYTGVLLVVWVGCVTLMVVTA